MENANILARLAVEVGVGANQVSAVSKLLLALGLKNLGASKIIARIARKNPV